MGRLSFLNIDEDFIDKLHEVVTSRPEKEWHCLAPEWVKALLDYIDGLSGKNRTRESIKTFLENQKNLADTARISNNTWDDEGGWASGR